MKRFSVLFLLSSLLFVSCEWLGLDRPDTDEAVEAVPLTLTKAQEAYVTNGNAFAVKLLAEMEKVSEALGYFFSPMSLSMALTMLLNGTKGEAYNELGAVLGYGTDIDISLVNDYCKQFIERAPTWDPLVSVSVANALVANKNYEIKTPFKATLQESFSAEVSSRDFTKTATLNYINDWCKKQTRGMIPKVLESINPSAILYLINAIYFKGAWASPFDPGETKKDVFYCADGSQQRVDMMHQKIRAQMYETNTAQSLVLFFGNGTFSLQIILPQIDKMEETVSEIATSGWRSFFPGVKEYSADTYLPAFEQQYSYHRSNLPLYNVGIHKILDGSADFSPICDSEFGISDIIHDSAFHLDESGAEASAVTVFELATAPAPLPVATFRADHPFLYAIVENKTGAIMFLGKYGGD